MKAWERAPSVKRWLTVALDWLLRRDRLSRRRRRDLIRASRL